jgi:hypothetical protein
LALKQICFYSTLASLIQAFHADFFHVKFAELPNGEEKTWSKLLSAHDHIQCLFESWVARRELTAQKLYKMLATEAHQSHN